MKTIITTKNYSASEKLKEIAEKKFEKLDKYFSNEITAQIVILREKEQYKTDATIKAKGTIFRAEVKAGDPYDGVDRVVEKLSHQMSKFKSKLQKKHKGHKELRFADLPEPKETQPEIQLARKKKIELDPMTVDEAIVQMEMLQHNFFLFINLETDTTCLVYRRNEKDYGLLEAI